MAYRANRLESNKRKDNPDRHLRIDDMLTSHHKPVKIGEHQTGLQLADKDIKIESDLTVGGETTLEGDLTVKGNINSKTINNDIFAGMILGYTTVGIDASDDAMNLTATMTTVDDALKVKFVAPPSEVVEISVQIYFDAARRSPVLGLSDQDTGDTYRAISFPNATDVTNEHLVAMPPSTLGDSILNNCWVVTGLTAGTAYEWWLGAKTNFGIGSQLRWGGTATNKYPPFIMKATALPTAVSDFAVYG